MVYKYPITQLLRIYKNIIEMIPAKSESGRFYAPFWRIMTILVPRTPVVINFSCLKLEYLHKSWIIKPNLSTLERSLLEPFWLWILHAV